MTTIYNWITDPAHGWLTVPLAELRELGIADDISQFSYISTSKGVAYLEEDCDALRFIKAKGIDIRDRKALSQWCDANTVTRHHDSAEGGSAGYIVGRGVYVSSATEAHHGSVFHPVRNCERFSVSAAA
tara:strand:+ start:155 stop:541 length:387 start_codon:yes stop_codon:yes gene_type:complete